MPSSYACACLCINQSHDKAWRRAKQLPPAAVKRESSNMFNLTRRQALATSGGILGNVACTTALRERGRRHTLTIAYNVNLPSFDPYRAVGGQPDDPGDLPVGLRSVHRPEAEPRFEPGLLTAWGWNDDKTKIWMDVRTASSGMTARRSRPKTSSGRSSAQASRRAAIRSSSCGWASAISRSTAIASPRTSSSSIRPSSNGWRSSPVTSCRKAYYEKVGAGRLREEADRHRAVHGRCL